MARYEETTRSVAAGGTDPVGRQRIAWGAVWGGSLLAVTVYLVLELVLFATGAREVTIDQAVNEAALLTALAALAAFFLGGVLAGATMPWTASPEGAIHGLMVWTLGIVAFLGLGVLGSGLALGGIGTATDQITRDVEEFVDDVAADEATEDARDAAGWAVVGLAITLAAAAAGGAVGAKAGAERRTRLEARSRTTAVSRYGRSDTTRSSRWLEDRTVDELREMAAERDVPGRSTMDKDELIDALRD